MNLQSSVNQDRITVAKCFKCAISEISKIDPDELKAWFEANEWPVEVQAAVLAPYKEVLLTSLRNNGLWAQHW